MKIEETQKATLEAKEVVEAIKMWMRAKGYEARSVHLTTEQYYVYGYDDRGPPSTRCSGATLDVVKIKDGK